MRFVFGIEFVAERLFALVKDDREVRRRLSAATGLFNIAMASAREAAEDFLRDGDSEALWQRRGSPPDYNKLFGG